MQAVEILRGMAGVEMVFFQSVDVVRHPLVARIVEAYDRDRESSS
ncbi:MAG: PhoH family protein [Acidithiobacillus sp.]